MRPWRVVLVIAGALAALVGFGSLAGGGTLIWAHTTQRDAAGFYTTPTRQLQTSTYALTSQVDLGSRPTARDWVPEHPLGTVRIRATGGGAIFVGVARQDDLDNWLAGVAHEHVTSMHFGPFRTETEQIAGSRPAAAPLGQPFWVASSSGPGTQTVLWPSESGRWSAVIMNADASPNVAVKVNVGAKTGVLLPIGIGLGAFGLMVFGVSALLIFLGLRRTPEEQAVAAAGPTAAPSGAEPVAAGVPAAPGTYPVRLDGHLDPGVSRWMWLVKFVLVIPHVIVLALLWLAVAALTVIAGFAILFTGRYPRPIFDFNVGVMRWTWRVAFYAYSALGTDRYPPFSMNPDPSYPAAFAVDYPEHLSRGLVLVKWWLLALPHYLVVAIFAGGLGFGFPGAWRIAAPTGLVSLLVLVAAVILGVSGQYPDSIFDFVMGMNRWCYRVLAYVTLMRDEYPPFRLDSGGADPGSVPVLPPPAPDRGGELIQTSR